jgi:hypothetical protein
MRMPFLTSSIGLWRSGRDSETLRRRADEQDRPHCRRGRRLPSRLLRNCMAPWWWSSGRRPRAAGLAGAVLKLMVPPTAEEMNRPSPLTPMARRKPYRRPEHALSPIDATAIRIRRRFTHTNPAGVVADPRGGNRYLFQS